MFLIQKARLRGGGGMQSFKRPNNIVVDKDAGILEIRGNLNVREPKNHQMHSIKHIYIYMRHGSTPLLRPRPPHC
jgi:hypothetical protein